MRMKGKKPIFNRKDTWNMDATLQPVILEALKKFKEVCSDEECVAGFPGRMYQDFGYEIENNNDEVHDILYAEWHKILDKMIWSFENYHGADDLNHESFGLFFGPKTIVDEDGNKRTSFGFNDKNAFDAYSKARDEHEEKVQEGIDLFAKYYKCLWW